MKIEKRFEKHTNKNNFDKFIYCVFFEVKNEKSTQVVFLDTKKMCEPDTVWIDINKFNDVKFLNDHGIDYILEGEDKNIIPIGLIDFVDNDKYRYGDLKVWNHEEINLHKSNQIIKNIERAIKIKYEAVKFIKRFDNFGSSKEEDIILD